MPFFKALGFGIAITIISLAMPKVFVEIQTTALAFLHGAEVSADVATSVVAAAGEAKLPHSQKPFELPQLPSNR